MRSAKRASNHNAPCLYPTVPCPAAMCRTVCYSIVMPYATTKLTVPCSIVPMPYATTKYTIPCPIVPCPITGSSQNARRSKNPKDQESSHANTACQVLNTTSTFPGTHFKVEKCTVFFLLPEASHLENALVTLLGPQSRFGDKLLRI